MRRRCPDWFQDRLTRVGGRNPHGDPIFKLVWGQHETMSDGGYFLRDGYEGYRDVLRFGGEKCWVILMWVPAALMGSRWRWEHDHRDEATGLLTLGEYPKHGYYRIVHKLVHREIVAGNLVTYRMEPTHFILDLMIPLIIRWNKLTNEERLAVIEEDKAKEEAEGDRILADSLAACKVRRDSPVVQKRLELMERTMREAMAIASCTQLGMRQIGA